MEKRHPILRHLPPALLIAANLIPAATTTQAGLKVKAERDESRYQTAIKPTPEQMASILMTRADFHGNGTT